MIASRERNKLVTWKKKTVLFLEMHNTDADTNFSLCLLHHKAKKEYFLWIKIKILYSDGLKGYFLKLNRTKQGDFSYESLGATFGDEICGWKKANANFSVTLVEKKKGEERNTLEGIPLIEKIAIGEDRSNLNSPSKRLSFLHNCWVP